MSQGKTKCNIAHIDFIKFISRAKFCRAPGSFKYESFVMSSTPPGGASVSFGNTFDILVMTCTSHQLD